VNDVAEFKTDTVAVNFTVSNPRAVNSKTLFALVDVEIDIAGVCWRSSASRPGVSRMAGPLSDCRLIRTRPVYGGQQSLYRLKRTPPLLMRSWPSCSKKGWLVGSFEKL
jgi:hypothetical protein